MQAQDYREETVMDPKDKPLVERDDDGRLIAELPSAELKRRLAILRDASDWRSRMFSRTYETTLRERGDR